MSKNFGHHVWPKAKSFKITLAKKPQNSSQNVKFGPENK